MRKLLSALIGASAVLMFAAAAHAVPADDGDLLSEFTTGGSVSAAPMSLDELGEVRGEGTATFSFLFPRLHHDIDQTFTFGTTTIHVVGDASTGEVTVTLDGPDIPDYP
jgi:hypothetical protein